MKTWLNLYSVTEPGEKQLPSICIYFSAVGESRLLLEYNLKPEQAGENVILSPALPAASPLSSARKQPVISDTFNAPEVASGKDGAFLHT